MYKILAKSEDPFFGYLRSNFKNYNLVIHTIVFILLQLCVHAYWLSSDVSIVSLALLTHFILKLVQTSCSQFLIISSNQSVSIKK